MSIKLNIERLSLESRRQLSHAFDNGFSQFVRLGEREFIGVHLNPSSYPNLEITEQVGVWSYGIIKDGN